MATEAVKVIDEQVVIAEEADHVRVITLNQPRQLNIITPETVRLLADYLEKWEKDESAELVLVKGAGRAYSAGGDLKTFYASKESRGDSCLEVVYRYFWLCYHIQTYKKTTVALVHGIAMGGGAALVVPMKFSVVTEKTVFATPEAGIGYHTDCAFSYMHPRLPGRLGEYLALTGARLNGKELVAIGFATHFVPLEKLPELEQRLIALNSGDESLVKSIIEEFAEAVEVDENSILQRLPTIDECFSKETADEILKSLEVEVRKEGNGWIGPVLKGLKRSSPTGLAITLKSVREGRNQTLAECFRKEFRLTMNILRGVISNDMFEGIRALTIDKDNSPKWEPASLDKINSKQLDLIFEPFEAEELELQIPEKEECRWDGRFETTVYPKTLGLSDGQN